MGPEDRQQLDVTPSLKAKLLKLLESRKLPLEELAIVLYMRDTPFASVCELVNDYEGKFQALSLDMWKLIFKKLQLSKELEDLLAVHQREMMVDPTAMDEVDCSGSLTAERSLKRNLHPSQRLNEPINVRLQDPLIKLPLVDPSAREHEGAIPKTKHRQPDLQSTVKPDVKEKMWMGTFGSQSHLNLPSIPWREFSDECAQSSLHPPESSERAVGNAAGCQRGNESQDTGFFSGEGNSYTQMSSLSTTPEHIGKTEHHSQVLKSVSARPTTPEGATTGRNSPSLATGCHYNRPINLNDPVEVDFVPENETGRPVEHYDARENNGLCEEVLQELESSTKDNLFLTRKLREMESVCNTLRENLFRCRQTFRESRPPCAYLQAENDRLQVENEELRRRLKEQELLNRILEESRLMRLSLAIRSRLETRRADDVASEGSSAAVEEDNASDNSIEEVELDVDEQPGPFPQESDSEDSDNDEFYEARDDLFL